jgi:uncharacterized hydrophobic protein (TIGR00271 family)
MKMSRLGNLMHGSPVTAGDLEVLQGKLLFDRVPVTDRYVRFFVLLFLSGIIATYGVISDSTAAVIGAMIVAPLMTPIMALSLGMVSGDARNIVRSLLIVAAGAAVVVGLAYLLAMVLPGGANVAGNSQVSSRVSPRLIDLVIALAAGAAGAFATGREDVSDALPGVAIAVSLVPPLSVVGICLAAGEPGQAWGAFLLFLTNFLAIAMAGLVLFAIMGYGGVALGLTGQSSRRWAIAAIILATLIIMVPLGTTSYQIAYEEVLQQQARSSVDTWLSGTEYELFNIEADGKKLNVVIAGNGTLPPLEDLLRSLGETTQGVEVNVRVLNESKLAGSTTL